MRMTKNEVIATVLIACGIMALTACQGKSGTTSASVTSSSDTITAIAESQQQPNGYLKAIDKYLVEEIGKNSPIPCTIPKIIAFIIVTI